MERHTDSELAAFAGSVASLLRGQTLGTPNVARIKLSRAALNLLWLAMDKNDAYGDSLFSPVEAFARDIDPATRIAVRLDDKVNRMVRGQGREALGEDTVVDIAGYCLALLALDDGPDE